jgi:hypothetical protein
VLSERAARRLVAPSTTLEVVADVADTVSMIPGHRHAAPTPQMGVLHVSRFRQDSAPEGLNSDNMANACRLDKNLHPLLS